jgi:hypothetical protein
MATRRGTSSKIPLQGVADAGSSSSNAGAKQQKQKTPPFLYLFPLLPILIMILMSGKSTDKEDSFAAPSPGVQIARAAAIPPIVVPEKVQVLVPEIVTKVVEPQEEEEPVVVADKKSSTTTSSGLKIIKQAELVSAPNTVVTGYFTLKSKFAKEEYLKWMSNMLSLQDAMVIFTSPELVETMQGFRQHALNRTVIIPMELEHVELVKKYDEAFWQHQLDIDPEKRIHKSYQLFWIWLSKSFLVKTAAELNIFNSDIYMWSDIGCFRNTKYNGKEMIAHREVVPTDRIFQMAHHEPQPPPYIWWNDKYNQKPLFYHSGSQMVGYKNTWLTFHTEFMATVAGFVERDMFIGEDQTVLQSTCLRIPTLCAYVPMTQVNDNHYFGLRFVVHNGGTNKYQYWYPPAGLPEERSDVVNKTLLEPMKPPPPPSKAAIRAA